MEWVNLGLEVLAENMQDKAKEYAYFSWLPFWVSQGVHRAFVFGRRELTCITRVRRGCCSGCFAVYAGDGADSVAFFFGTVSCRRHTYVHANLRSIAAFVMFHVQYTYVCSIHDVCTCQMRSKISDKVQNPSRESSRRI